MRRGILLRADDQLRLLLRRDGFEFISEGAIEAVAKANVSSRGRLTIPQEVRTDADEGEYAVVRSDDGIIHLIPSHLVTEAWRDVRETE